MAFVEETIGNLIAQGFFDYILPFLLIFFIAFAIFEQTKVLGTNKGIHAAISMIIGLFMLYFAHALPVGRFLSFFSGKSFLTIFVLIVIAAMTTFVFKVMQTNGMIKEKEEWKYAIIILICVGVVVLLILNSSPSSWETLFGAGA
jgi:hypothetical protein